MRQIVLDTETTGLETTQGHRIIEIGCVELVNRQLTGNNLHFYINPEREVDAGALAVHGITREFLLDKPLFVDIAQTLWNYFADGELIIHNAPFDLGFLDYEFGLLKSNKPQIAETCSIIDTLVLARQLHPGQKNNLDALCKRYHINNTHRELHGALLDAEILANVYLAMTGGQITLFGEELASSDNQSHVDAAATNFNEFNLPVIFANEKETAAHARLIDKLKGK